MIYDPFRIIFQAQYSLYINNARKLSLTFVKSTNMSKLAILCCPLGQQKYFKQLSRTKSILQDQFQILWPNGQHQRAHQLMMVLIIKGNGIFLSWCIYEEYCVLKRIVFKKNPKQVVHYARRATYMLKCFFFCQMDNIRGPYSS